MNEVSIPLRTAFIAVLALVIEARYPSLDSVDAYTEFEDEDDWKFEMANAIGETAAILNVPDEIENLGSYYDWAEEAGYTYRSDR